MKLTDYINDIQLVEDIEKKNGRFFPMTRKKEPIGRKSGYLTAKEAVKVFYQTTMKSFDGQTDEQKETLIANYLKSKGLK